ncbi:MAG: homoserine dehydrogenase [Thermodesulfobacteriota bacterium]|nr:homoserine dehydrogenase [Thermodesulfobacteriota bacterium]
MKKIEVGLVGFGTIGTGTVKILQENKEAIEGRLGATIVLKRIADLDITTDRGIEIDKRILTTDVTELINDPDISILIELIGGYNETKEIILQAIKKKKHIVTANKALLAIHGKEIFKKAHKEGVDIGFEASVGGGIPIIHSIKEGLAANNIKVIFGILNGTCNYILSEMTSRNKDFKDVLKDAQNKGYAEADPTLDIEGIDSAHKLAILLTLSYGINVDLEDIYTEGISRITPLDIEFAKELGYTAKLLAIAKEENNLIQARIHPTLVPNCHLLSMVNGVYNAIFINGDAVGSTMFYGKGAGMMPTGSAVVSDIVELCRNIIKGSSKRVPSLSFQYENMKEQNIKAIDDTVNRYYLRFSAKDRPGVLSKISGILGNLGISISSVIQKGREIEGAVPILMLTHEAKEANVQKALRKIDNLPITLDKTVLIRIEDGSSTSHGCPFQEI